MARRWCAIVWILGWILFLPGCWDVQEISNRGIANTVFFDTGDQGEVRMGVVLAVPGTAVPPNVGTMQQFLQRHYVIIGAGESVVQAWARLQAATVRNIFFGQTRAIILSEELAREDINDALDFIGRIPLIPPNTHVLVAENDPETLLELDTRDNYLPGEYIDFYFRSYPVRALAIPTILWQVYSAMDEGSSDPHLPLIQPGEEAYTIAGTALFSRNRMVGKLDEVETQTLAMLKGADMAYLTVPLDEERYVALWNVRSRTELSPRWAGDDSLHLHIDTSIDGRVVETYPHRLIDWHEKQEIEREAARLIQKSLEDLIAKLQDLKTDPAGFAGKFRLAYPRKWGKVDWHEIYSRADITVEVSFTVRETGLHR